MTETTYEPQVGDVIEVEGKEYTVFAVRPTHRTHGEGAGEWFGDHEHGLTFIDEDDYEYWVYIYEVTFVRREENEKPPAGTGD